MMSRTALLLPVLAGLLAACQPSGPVADKADAAPSEAAATSPSATEGTDAIAVVHHDRGDPAGFDRKAFAGAFAGVLPCADCPGIEVQLQIEADGRFSLRETYQERDTAVDTRGTWNVDDAGRQLLLDPDTKEDADRHFAIVSRDELRMLDTGGQPIDAPFNLSLRRH